MLKNEPMLAGLHCLVLDDEFLIALDLEQLLESAAAASITCFSNSQETLDALRDGGRFDLGVLDIRLGSGARTSLSVADALAERQIPFIFLTGMQTDQTITARYPQVPVLEKPYRQVDLFAALDRVLKPKRKPQGG